MPRRRLQGTVVSDKMDKTVVVRVERRRAHPLYRKVIRHHKRYKAHDENNEAHIGDVVVIEEDRPLSREKRWRVVSWLTRGAAR
jgi:small subunit ribosomal protein S17